ncbi:MAG: PTS transporter subunit EIIC [Candidatus Baltobacteraceae bacterium]
MITPADETAEQAVPVPPPSSFVARVRAIAESPEMVSVRTTLPYSFAGLAVGLGVFMLLQPGGTFLERFSSSFAPAFGVMSILLVLAMTFDLARRRRVPVAAALLGASAAFVISLPFAASSSPQTLLAALGSSGLFLAMGIALLSVNLLRASCARFGPAAGSLVAVATLAVVALALLGAGISVTGLLDKLIAPLGHLGDSLTALLVITLVETLLWTVGIHGPALLAAVVLPVYMNLQVQNTNALSHGLPLPHLVTVSTFLFVFPGGAGATLPLVLLLLRSKVKRIRSVAYATLLPSLFNANEPLMFGLPLVLNPILSAPFVLTPLALAVISYAAMSLGLVSRPAYYMPSTLPVPLGAFLATKDWRSIVLMGLNLIVGLAIYAPFAALFERHESERERAREAA